MAGKTTAAKAGDNGSETGNVDELKALNETLAQKEKDLNDLSDKIKVLESENSSLKEMNEGLGKTVEELNAALADKDTEIQKKGGRPIIKDGNDSYELRLKKFVHRIGGKAVEVDEAYLKAHPEVVKDLIEKKSGALVKKGGK